MLIVVDDLTGPGIVALLDEHLRDMRATSPPESVHALDLDGLRDPAITVWTVVEDGAVVGCGALKVLEPGHAEIKSMRTAASHQGRGIGTAVLRHLLAEARARGLHRLSLETGTQEFFAPARALYARHGFVPCPPFAGYTDDPNSAYLTLELAR
ncbi:GNAT family N-acetyltransferase [Pseudonocardia broussonetiae]|nr:GNAT family N-acetyltransferase [Pseudonocardia broussonetiae]